MANEKVVTLDNLRKFKEKCDEKYLSEDRSIEVVDEIPSSLTDTNLKTLYRVKSNDNDVDNINVIDKEVTPANNVTSNCIVTENDTQITNYDTFNGYFDTSLNELYGENFTISDFYNIYTAYYPDIDGSSVSAIRIGTEDLGWIILSNLPEGITKLKLIVGKYFSYDTQTGQKIYDENAVLYVFDFGEGSFSYNYELEEEPTELEINLEDIGHEDGMAIALYSYGSSVYGRVFLYGFIVENEETIIYTPKELAKKEYIEARVQEVKTYTEARVQEVKTYTEARVQEVKTYTEARVQEVKTYTEKQINAIKSNISLIKNRLDADERKLDKTYNLAIETFIQEKIDKADSNEKIFNLPIGDKNFDINADGIVLAGTTDTAEKSLLIINSENVNILESDNMYKIIISTEE